MKKSSAISAVFLAVLCGCSEPIYFSSRAAPNYTDKDNGVFIAPYVTRVSDQVQVQIATASQSTGVQNQTQPSAQTATKIQPQNGSNATVSFTTPAGVTGTAKAPDGSTITIESTNTPPTDDKGGTTKSSKLTVNLYIVPIALEGAYLYMRRNALFDNSVDFKIGPDGLPTSSDSNSTQEVTTILSDIASTAAGIVSRFAFNNQVSSSSINDCYQAVAKLATTAPLDADPVSFEDDGTSKFSATFASAKGELPLMFSGRTLQGNSGNYYELALKIDHTSVTGWSDTKWKVTSSTSQSDNDVNQSGFSAYLPEQVTLQLVCYPFPRNAETAPVGALSAPVVKNAWLERVWLNPVRDTFTSPKDTFSFVDGVITEHKFTNESGVKNAVEMLTSPAKAALSVLPVPSQTTKVTTVVAPTGTTKTTETDTTN